MTYLSMADSSADPYGVLDPPEQPTRELCRCVSSPPGYVADDGVHCGYCRGHFPGIGCLEHDWLPDRSGPVGQRTAGAAKSRPSYHDRIQQRARAVEADRAKTYDNTSSPRFSLRELEYAMGAVYKLLRVLNDCTSDAKALDDTLDAYNYCALLYDALLLRSSQGGETHA